MSRPPTTTASWRSGTRRRPAAVIDVDPGRFEDIVVAALDGLPEDLGRLMRNVG